MDHDPIRFALYATTRTDDEDWQLLGSSTYVNFAGYVSLWHGAFSTSETRGKKHTFDLFRLAYGPYMAVIRAVCSLIASLSSVAEATNVGVLLVATPEFVLGCMNVYTVRPATLPPKPAPLLNLSSTSESC
jgi:hypothetical protein